MPRRERVVSDGADVLTMSRWPGVRALCLCCAVHRSQESLQVDVSLLASVLQAASLLSAGSRFSIRDVPLGLRVTVPLGLRADASLGP